MVQKYNPVKPGQDDDPILSSLYRTIFGSVNLIQDHCGNL
jgi:hypothetical protein